MDRWRKQFAPSTVYSTTRYLARFLRHLEAHGAPPLAHLLKRVRRPRPRTTIPTSEELPRMYAAAAPHMRCWLLLTAQLGLRWSEALRVCPDVWNHQAHTITVLTKGTKVRTLPTTPDLEALFLTAPDAPDRTIAFVWLLRRKGPFEPWIRSERTLRSDWRSLIHQAGANTELTPHDLRRSVAERLYVATKDIRAVQQFLGHDNIATTAMYLEHKDTAALRALQGHLQWLKPQTEVKQ